jgi:dihydrofolate reductase
MILSAIAAMAKNRGIGKNNILPWHIPEDFKYFKEKTLGRVLIMGRKTFESLPKPLPNRVHVIITRDTNYLNKVKLLLGSKFSDKDFFVVNSLDAAMDLSKQLLDPSHPAYRSSFGNEVFISGGSEIYTQSLPLLDRLYLTIIDQAYESDAFFPDFSHTDLKLVSSDPRSANAETKTPSFSFLVFER